MECSDEEDLDECEMVSESEEELDGFEFEESKPTHPLLLQEIDLLKTVVPESNVTTKLLTGICQLDLEMSFPTTHLNEIVMTAWGLKFGSPIIMHLMLHPSLYLSAAATIRADVFQESSATCSRNGTLQQLKNIAQAFIVRQCRSLTNEKLGLVMAMCGEHYDGKGQDAQQGQINRDPPLDYGFLVQIYFYMQERLMNLNKFCPICDERHPQVISNAMLKPVVCNKPLCIFSFQTLGVTSYITSYIQSQPQVVQLLVLLTKAAISSKRHSLILSPFPTLVHPEKPEKIVSDPLKDLAMLRSVLKKMPKIRDIQHLSEDELKKKLESLHILCYPLLRWIISSNRSHIEKIPVEKQLAFMRTKHQFLLFNRPPEEDDIFKEQKKKLGSIFAFHGSPIDNWHAIVRQGLVIASGTDKQLNGAAFGAGIYMSPLLSKSMGYSALQGSTKSETITLNAEELVDDFIYESQYLFCIALCEGLVPELLIDFLDRSPDLLGVYNSFIDLMYWGDLTMKAYINHNQSFEFYPEFIKDDNLKKHNNQIWTCSKSENVCTRFIFVYDIRCPVLAGIDANIGSIPYCNQVQALGKLYS